MTTSVRVAAPPEQRGLYLLPRPRHTEKLIMGADPTATAMLPTLPPEDVPPERRRR